MENDKLSIHVPIDINMQDYYDNLVLLRNSLNAQINELAKDNVSICTHDKEFLEEKEGIIWCKKCGKVIKVKNN